MSTFVYHGTSESSARRALKRGILPRKMSGKKGNWEHTVQSNPSMVYLTVAYAPYFAVLSTGPAKKRVAIIQIDLDKLDSDRLYPDEDFIEQALRGKRLGNTKLDDMHARNKYIIQHIERYRSNWMTSLAGLGTVCHNGAVPKEAITKAIVMDVKKGRAMLREALEPTITIANYRFCGEYYRALNNWFFGAEMEPEQLAFGIIPKDAAKQILPDYQKMIDEARKHVQNRSAIETIFGGSGADA
jgi:hypothetical protein